MMRKTLWALALLFVLSGCNDGGEDTPPKQDDLVNTTFNIEYSLNLDTPSINYPSSYNQQSPAPAGGIPTIPDGLVFRIVAELWEELPVDVANPSAGVYYKRYNRKIYFTYEHTPVAAGQSDRYGFTHEARIAKGKFKMLLWGDYVSARYVTDRYFGTTYVNQSNTDIKGLRCIVMTRALQREDYDALSGVQDVDLTVYEGVNMASATVDASMERVFGKYTLVATDLQEYKDLFTAEEYESAKKPLEVKIDYGAEYVPILEDEGTGEVVNGMRAIYDALSQSVTHYQVDQEMQLPVISEDGSEIVLTFDYALAQYDNSPLKNVKMTIYGPMNYPIAKLNISEIPITRNKETFFRAKFFTNAWDSGEAGEDGITITDDFDDIGGPTDL